MRGRNPGRIITIQKLACFADQRQTSASFIARKLHFLVGTSMEPTPAAITGHGANVNGSLKCPYGQVGAENKAVAHNLPRARGLLGHGPRKLERDPVSPRSARCGTTVLKDIPDEHLSSTAFQDAFTGLLFCWKKKLPRDFVGTQQQPTN